MTEMIENWNKFNRKAEKLDSCKSPESKLQKCWCDNLSDIIIKKKSD